MYVEYECPIPCETPLMYQTTGQRTKDKDERGDACFDDCYTMLMLVLQRPNSKRVFQHNFIFHISRVKVHTNLISNVFRWTSY